MKKWDDIIWGLAKKSGAKGVEELTDAIDGIVDMSKESWQRAIVSLVQDAIAEDGLDGLKNVKKIVSDAIDGKGINIDFASLKTRSDFLAAMQNMEADGKEKALELIKKIGHYLAVFIKSILAGLK